MATNKKKKKKRMNFPYLKDFVLEEKKGGGEPVVFPTRVKPNAKEGGGKEKMPIDSGGKGGTARAV